MRAAFVAVFLFSALSASVNAQTTGASCTFTTSQSTILGGFVYAIGYGMCERSCISSCSVLSSVLPVSSADYFTSDAGQVSWDSPARDNAKNCRQFCSKFQSSPMALVLPNVVCSCKLPVTPQPPTPNINIQAWPAGPSGTMTVPHNTALSASCYSGVVLNGQQRCVNGVIQGPAYVCPSVCALTDSSIPNGRK
jgi:hypothetical protein